MSRITHVNEVVRSLILAFIFEFYDTLERFVKMAPKSFNSSQRIFKTFIDRFLAESLHIYNKKTPRMLCEAQPGFAELRFWRRTVGDTPNQGWPRIS